jgi:dihydroxyacid dehydratase/phosphogluconate dehydratase
MLSGTFRGEPLGCGSDVWRLSEKVRGGTLSQQDFDRSESSMIRSRGHCNTMGTASTMAEALGTVVPGVAGTPAPDSRLLEASRATGRLAVELVSAGRRPSEVITRASSTPSSPSRRLAARATRSSICSRSPASSESS